MDLDQEFFTIVAALEETGIPYAVAGGIALAWHGHPRFTRDIDIVVLAEAMPDATRALHTAGYLPSAPPWRFTSGHFQLARFLKTAEDGDHLELDLLITDSPEAEQVVRAAVITQGNSHLVRIVSRKHLIWMKSLRSSAQDKIDIENLDRPDHLPQPEGHDPD